MNRATKITLMLVAVLALGLAGADIVAAQSDETPTPTSDASVEEPTATSEAVATDEPTGTDEPAATDTDKAGDSSEESDDSSQESDQSSEEGAGEGERKGPCPKRDGDTEDAADASTDASA